MSGKLKRVACSTNNDIERDEEANLQKECIYSVYLWKKNGEGATIPPINLQK